MMFPGLGPRLDRITSLSVDGANDPLRDAKPCYCDIVTVQ
jgi:hypothetical protein